LYLTSAVAFDDNLRQCLESWEGGWALSPLFDASFGLVGRQANFEEPSLTVLLPNFNHAAYLPRAIDAIVGQSRPADELIVIDDASTDGSREVISLYQSRYPRLTALYNLKNLGALRTLQRGLEAARGRYVYLAAADDEILPGFFERALCVLEAMPEIGLFCGETILIDRVREQASGFRPVVRPLRKAGRLSPEAVVDLLERADNFVHTGSAIFRGSSLRSKGGFALEAGSFSDGLLARKIALTEGMWFEPAMVSRWFIDPSSFSRTTALVQHRAIEAMNTVPKWIAADPDFPSWYPKLFRRRWQFGSARLALDAVPTDRDIIAAMVSDTRLGRIMFRMLAPFLSLHIGRLALLASLAVCLKPFRLRDVARTALDRRIERVQSWLTLSPSSRP
jgi:glycosyltransferase involved in cell wall biosynthesis